MDLNALRISALRTLIANRPLKEFADAHDLDASYLSQLLNGHRRLGEKAAAKMERQIGLADGVLVNPAPGTEGDQPPDLEETVSSYRVIPKEEEILLRKLQEARRAASPTSQQVLSRLIAAAQNGTLDESAWTLIGSMLTELEKR